MKQQRGRPFAAGVSGNPSGRPAGSRNKLTEDFLRVVAEDFALHGKEAVERVRDQDPAAYLRVVSQIVPKEVKLDDDTLASLGRRDLVAIVAALGAAESDQGGAGTGVIH